MKRRNQSIIALTAGFLFLFSIPLFAGVVNDLHTFESGTPALASQVNKNFDDIKSAVNDNNARIDTKQNKIGDGCDEGLVMQSIDENGIVECVSATSEMKANFDTLKKAVDDNSAQIDTKQNKIGGGCDEGLVMQGIDENDTVICVPDKIGDGDITAVNAGTGLTGGGDSRDVTLSINHGEGSGLDADLLDGEEGASYVRRNEETIALSGDLVVAGELDVSGDLTVPNIVYDPVHTHYLSIHPRAFGYSGDLAYGEGNNLITEGEFIAPVNLPHNAQITSFTGYFSGSVFTFNYQELNVIMDLSLGYYRLDGPSQTIMASVTSQKTNVYHHVEDPSIIDENIDNENRAYFIRGYSKTWPGSIVGITYGTIGIRGAVITYTISEAP